MRGVDKLYKWTDRNQPQKIGRNEIKLLYWSSFTIFHFTFFKNLIFFSLTKVQFHLTFRQFVIFSLLPPLFVVYVCVYASKCVHDSAEKLFLHNFVLNCNVLTFNADVNVVSLIVVYFGIFRGFLCFWVVRKVSGGKGDRLFMEICT